MGIVVDSPERNSDGDCCRQSGEQARVGANEVFFAGSLVKMKILSRMEVLSLLSLRRLCRPTLGPHFTHMHYQCSS
ncbi:hypothetical protein DPMN_130622 [Dreissena polymorpha]|uniref:Uncharacterized protein n=1 Tax=Dreissena polymorpha TaxID=45954 RepID=A0A9D4H500_DREPO|nr:hypothetical protein DPMN_130622 [Dreissena polymorpha]